ncbi:hypothetical protein BGZ70_008187 [Mortierella alpina]|uniref:Uncharacterized protein n=1 Tax=Mortierella alpina TaxID=64518 RepID=A0A9P6JFV3_MORAP|nr:hypothetical protein BGZ70_008187 [Mortierella alpina]
MPNVQSKISTTWSMIPAKYVNRMSLEVQRTFLVALSLLKTHRRKAILLSLGPATILKFITVLLPIIKLLPPTVKAIQALGYFTRSRDNSSSNNSRNSNSGNALANRDANAAASADGPGMSMDELSEILWTPAEDSYWERVNAMVSRFGLCKTLGISLAGVRPGRVEVIMPFRAEVSGEGGAFHASLLPALIALTSQLTGMTLLPRHFTLKPIDFKCNILSDCGPSTYLLVSRGAVVVRGDHSITVKVEILKASGIVSGSSEVVTSPSVASATSFFSWKSWAGSASSSTPVSPSLDGGNVLVPGTGIERRKFVVCASGMQTSVVVRADTNPSSEEENEMMRLRKERERRLERSSTSRSSSSFSAVDVADESIILGDSFQLRPSSPLAVTPKEQEHGVHPTNSGTLDPTTPSLQEPVHNPVPSTTTTAETTHATDSTPTAKAMPLSYASAVRHGVEQEPLHHHQHQHQYDETSDTEAWQGH